MFRNDRSKLILLMVFALFFCISGAGAVSAADAPVANFTSNTTQGSAPLAVQFNDTSSNNPTSWNWDFGDNRVSTDQNPTHTYTTPGTYNVTLIASNDAGSSTISLPIIISAIPPVVNFTATNNNGSYPLIVKFTDKSQNAKTWLWDFGDGTTSTLQNPTHTYTSKGNYTVGLTETNDAGSSTLILTNYVQATNIITTYHDMYLYMSNHNGIANPDGGPTNAYYFTQGGLNQLHITNNATISRGQVTTNPSQSGTFYITTSGGRGSNDDLILLVAVKGPIGNNFSVNILSSGYVWTPGSTNTNNYVIGAVNDTFTSTDFLYGPQVLRPASADMNVIYNGQNTSDPTTAMYLMFIDLKVGNINKAPINNGAATVTYTFYNLTNQASFDTYAWATGYNVKWTNPATQSGYNVIPTPIANFTSNITKGAVPLTVQFTDTSVNNPTNWLWDFGDGTTSTDQNPTHTYSNTGNYTVTLTAFNNLGNNTITQTNYITVNYQAPVANFTADKTKGASPLTVQFTDTSNNHPTSWLWDFGDGTTSTEQNPLHTYTALGNYIITLIATNSAGSSTLTQNNYINVFNGTAPNVNATPDNGIYNKTQTVSLTSDQPDAVIYYTTNGSNPTDSNNNNRVPYSNPIPINNSTVINFAAVNNGGVWSSRYNKNYIIDTSIPTVTASPIGGNYGSSQTVKLTGSDADTNTTVYYTTDGTDPKTSSTSKIYTVPITINTTTTLRYIAVDEASNWSTAQTETYTIDTVNPTANVNIKTGLYNKTQNVTLSMSETGNIYYTLNGDTPTATCNKYTGPISITNTTTLKYLAIDLAGNISPVYTETYTIDKKAATVTANTNSGLYNTNKVVKLTMSKNGTIYYTLNGKTPTTSSSKYTGPITIKATSTLKFFAVDLAGNKSQVYTNTYTIDKTAPKPVKTTPAQNSKNVSLTAPITIKFSENISKGVNFSKIYIKNLNTCKIATSTVTSIKGNIITIKMSKSRLSLNNYQIIIPTGSVKDKAGNKNSKYVLNFKTSKY